MSYKIHRGDGKILRGYQLRSGNLVPLWSGSLHPVLIVETNQFSPVVRLYTGSTATIEWQVNGTTVATGLNPTINFADSGPYEVHMICSAPDEVQSLNLGFAHSQDSGLVGISSSNNLRTQGVTSITGLTSLTNLRYFMAARTNGSGSWSGYSGPLLAGHLDLSGLANLEHVECYRNNLQSVDLTGCDSLIRLCVEGTNMTELDLNPVGPTLYDLRAADMQGGALHFTTMTTALSNLYHFCVRTQNLTGLPDHTILTAVQQYWPWDCGLDEDEVLIRSSRPLDSVRFTHLTINGPQSTIRRLDLAGQTWAPTFPSEPEQRLEAWDVGMESIVMTGMGPVDAIRLQDNLLPQADVDHVLAVANAWGTSGGILLLAGNTAPSSAGVAHANNLISRGWTVTYTAPPPIPDSEAPLAPSNFVAGTPTDTTIPTTWTAATDNIGVTGYETSTDGTNWTSRGNVLSYTFVGLLPGATYTLYVRAFDAAGNRGPESQTTLATQLYGAFLWADEFDRSDVTGWANVGNGWLQPTYGSGTGDLAIASGQLVATGTESFYQMIVNTGVDLPNDLWIELDFTNDANFDDSTGFFGIVARSDGTGSGLANGIKCLFTSSLANPPRSGTTFESVTGQNMTAVDNYQFSGWLTSGNHTMAIRLEANTMDLYLDGVHAATRTSTEFVGYGTHIGICGEPRGRHWQAIRVYSLDTEPDGQAPMAPSNFVAGTPTTTTIPTSWTAATDNIGVTGYETSRDGVSWTMRGNSLSYTFTGLTPGVEYTLYVRAYDADGNRGPEVQIMSTTQLYGSLIWADEFDRADVTGWAAVGNGWLQPFGTSPNLAISDEQLVFTGTVAFNRAVVIPSVTIPADCIVEVEFEVGDDFYSSTGYFGIVARMDNTGTAGEKCMFVSDHHAAPRRGSATTGAGPVLSAAGNGVPVSWMAPGVNTFAIRLEGQIMQAYLNGQLAWRTDDAVNGAGSMQGIGICGEPRDRHWRAIRVYSLN